MALPHLSQTRIAIVALAMIMSIRMLGLFMILPVFSTAALKFKHATPTLIGLALGIYGLTQAISQIPLGMLSDRIGRKPVIFGGLLLLCIGSVIAARTNSIYVLLIGRALQGAGAIGSTVLALTADLTRVESRSKAMAILGFSIGFAFTLSLVLGPIVNNWFQLSGIFWSTAILAVIAILLLIAVIPTPLIVVNNTENLSFRQCLALILKNKNLLRLDFSIFFLHAILTALFLALPFVLSHIMKLNAWHQVKLYLFVLIVSFSFAFPLIMFAEKKQKTRFIFLCATMALTATPALLIWFHQNVKVTIALLLLFFTAFTFLEAVLPALISKIAPREHKGAAMGVYSSSQFLGIFTGGALSGWVLAHAGLSGVFLLCACFGLFWLITMFVPETSVQHI